MVQTVVTGTGASRALRWENGALPVAIERVVVDSGGCQASCGPDDVYRLRVYETTGAIARVNNSGTQVVVLILQNATASTVQGHVRFWTGAGSMALEQAFSLPARGSSTHRYGHPRRTVRRRHRQGGRAGAGDGLQLRHAAPASAAVDIV